MTINTSPIPKKKEEIKWGYFKGPPLSYNRIYKVFAEKNRMIRVSLKINLGEIKRRRRSPRTC